MHHEAGCAEGLTTCIDSIWSPCRPDFTDQVVTKRDGTDPVRCGSEGTIANACDPECQAIAPPDPDFGGGGPPVDWEAGDVGGLPAGALSAGLPADCDSDADCQFDHFCRENADGGAGDCVAYSPWRGNAACGSDYDITAAIPCDDVVPVCNRGNAVVPVADLASMRIAWRTPPTYGMDGCSIGTAEGSCSISADDDLEIGECVEVACAVPPGKVVYVDAGSGNANECECQNNWTFDAGSVCGEPNCGSEVSVADEVPVTLFLSLDISGSMGFHRDCPYPTECDGTCDADNCSGTCTSTTSCSSHRGDVDACCWMATSASSTRWAAIHDALNDFVASESSDGLGLVMKTWPEGTCRANACNAVDEFIDPGTCEHSPCDTTGGALAAGCAAYVSDVCATNAREYCCGGLPRGTCAFSPCTASASTLASGCGGSGTPIRTATSATCATRGYEGCCNGAPGSGGNWGMNKAPCTATTSMTCRSGTGSSIACNSSAAGAAPPTSLTYAAYLTTTATPTCTTTWSASCVTAFRSHFAAQNGGRDPCARAWDAACVARYTSLSGATPGSSCSYSMWDGACVSRFDALGGTCRSTACNHPTIPAGCESVAGCPLRLEAAASDAAEVEILAALDAIVPGGGTPSAIAVDGAADFCRRYGEAHPDERCAVVFVSDGAPTQCGGTEDVYDAASTAEAAGVGVYAIGISGAGTSFMNQVASEGGTGQAFFVSPDTTASTDFLEALEEIRNGLLCTYRVPEGATPETLDVTWNDGVTNPVIAQVADYAACEGLGDGLGYYLDGDEQLSLCPDTCASIKGVDDTNVEVSNRCGAEAVPATVVDTLSAGVACDGAVGGRPKWTVMHYQADVPARSSITVQVRTRAGADQPWSELVDLVEIVEANEVSDLSAPPSLTTALGDAAYAPEIEVQMSTVVDGGAPTMIGYELQLTCEFSE